MSFNMCKEISAVNIPNTNVSWPTIFGYTTWVLWTNRCNKVFTSNSLTTDALNQKCRWLWKDHDQFWNSNNQLVRKTSDAAISWNVPGEGEIKWNVDGSVRSGGYACCGGVLRDHNGHWVCGFAHNMGDSTIMVAELTGILNAMKCVDLDETRKVIVETDSFSSVQMILSGVSNTHPCAPMISRIKHMLETFPNRFAIHHVFREANQVADRMANFAHQLPEGFHEYREMPSCCYLSMFHDDVGTVHPRAVAF